MAQSEMKGFSMSAELPELDQLFIGCNPVGNEAVFNTGGHQDAIHLDEARAKLR